jgi:hypothetical protein
VTANAGSSSSRGDFHPPRRGGRSEYIGMTDGMETGYARLETGVLTSVAAPVTGSS